MRKKKADKELFNLVGTQPEISLEEEKQEIREIIRKKMKA